MRRRLSDLAGQSQGIREARRGFTLIELLVVLIIVGIVSAVALPAVLPALAHRQVSEAGRIVQGALVGARDQAIHDGQPSGIRLIPDPTFWLGSVVIDGVRVPVPLRLPNGQIDPSQPIAYNRIVPIGPAPEYSEGRATVRAGFAYANAIHNPAGSNVAVPSLVLEEAPVDAKGAPHSPASWAWNIRVGDQVQLNGAGPWYTVAGPLWTPNPEGFVNFGPAGTPSPLNPTGQHRIEWLVLTNGRDDNTNGWTDEGFDGVDNNGNGLTDEAAVIDGQLVSEWEAERWAGPVASGVASVPYAIRRRALPMANAREVALPTQIVIDAARSRLPIDPMTGAVDLLIQPDGTAMPSLPYGVPASLAIGSEFEHFALVAREDVAVTSPIPPPKEDWSVLTLFRRTGQILVSDNPDPAHPFAAAQQGSR